MSKTGGKWVKGAWKDNTSMLAQDKKSRKIKLKDTAFEEFLEKHKHFNIQKHKEEAKKLKSQAEDFIKKEDWGSSANASLLAKFHDKAIKFKNESILNKINIILF
jgi:hypothetical protein